MRLGVSKRWLFAVGLAVATAMGWLFLSERGEAGADRVPIRRTAGRLSVPTEHRPCRWEAIADRTLPRTSCGHREESRSELIAASRDRPVDGTDRMSADHWAGVSLLLASHPAAAVTRLEAAVRRTPTPDALSDLAAARIELALATDDAYALVQALDDLERAARRGQSSMASRYNQALVLGLLNLRDPSREAWRSVRRHEREEGWRSDSEAWLDRLNRPTVAEEWKGGQTSFLAWLAGQGAGDEAALHLARSHPQHARVLAEDEGFGAWATAAGAGQDAAAAAIATRLVALGRELASVTGDELLAQAAEAVATCEGVVCRDLVDGHSRYTHARRLHEDQDYEPARPLFLASFEALSRAGTSFAVWPAFYNSVIIAHRPDFEGGSRQLRALLDHPGAAQPITEAYLHWMLGWISRRRSERGDARREFTAARDLFRATEQRENEGEMESRLGALWDDLGEPRRAWRHHVRALSLLASSIKPRRIENTLSTAATSLRSQGRYAASLVLQQMCVARARSRDNGLAAAVALRYLAQSYAGLGEELEALRAVREGLEWVDRIPDRRLAADPRVHLLLTWGTVARTDREEALERVEEAIRFATKHDLRNLLPEGHATAAALRRELGDLVGERRALTAAVEEIERQRMALAPEARLGFAASARKVMEQGALSFADRGEWAEAFAFADRLRARALWDAMAPNAAGGGELRRESLAPDEAVLAYLVLSDRTLGWWVRHDLIQGFEVAAGREVVADLVRRFRRAARDGDAGELARSRLRLSTLLYPGLGRELERTERLIVIPDGALAELPFAALEDAAGGVLAGRIGVTTLPAAGLYSVLEPWAGRSDPLVRWLLIADPVHSTDVFPALGRLSAGRALVQGWNSRPRSRLRVLSAEEATAAAFLEAAPDADAVVFLGHALAPTADTRRAGLVLAPDGGDDGLLELHEVHFEGRGPPRLAVLAGCGTASGRVTATEGSLTVGWSFLRAGVPSVVATLWEVDTAGATAMTRLLLDAVAAGEEQPLRVAQRRAIDSGEVPPKVWMAFQSIGLGG